MPRRPALPGQTLAFRARPEGANFCVAFKLQGGWDSEIIGKSVASLRAEGLRLLRVDFWVEDVGIMKTSAGSRNAMRRVFANGFVQTFGVDLHFRCRSAVCRPLCHCLARLLGTREAAQASC